MFTALSTVRQAMARSGVVARGRGVASRSNAVGYARVLRLASATLVVCGGLLLSLVSGASASVAPSISAEGLSHEVVAGDSLSAIARKYGVATGELAAANSISDRHVIKAGQILTIPIRVYVVGPGDTVGHIAEVTGVSRRSLVEMNGLTNPNQIRVGARLRLPTASASVTGPAAAYDALPGRLLGNQDRLALIGTFERWAAHYGVPPDLLMAVAYRESGWQSDVVSVKGAVGVGQLMPTTSAWLARDLIGVDLDPRDPDDNIRMSARFLRWVIGYMGSEEAAIAGYYQGPGSVGSRGYYDDTKAYIFNIEQIRPLFRPNR